MYLDSVAYPRTLSREHAVIERRGEPCLTARHEIVNGNEEVGCYMNDPNSLRVILWRVTVY